MIARISPTMRLSRNPMSSCHPGAYRPVTSVQPELEARFLCLRTLHRSHLRSVLSDEHLELSAAADERTLLAGFLDRHRETVVREWPGSPTSSCARTRCLPPTSPSWPRAAGAKPWRLQTVIVGEYPARLHGSSACCSPPTRSAFSGSSLRRPVKHGPLRSRQPGRPPVPHRRKPDKSSNSPAS